MVGSTLAVVRRNYPFVLSLLLHAVGVGALLWVSGAGARKMTFGGPSSVYVTFGGGAAGGATGTGPKAGDPKAKEGSSGKKTSQSADKQSDGDDAPPAPKPKKLPTKAESKETAAVAAAPTPKPAADKPKTETKSETKTEKKPTVEAKATPAPPKKTATAKATPAPPKKPEKVEKTVAKAPTSSKKVSNVKPVAARKEVAAAPTPRPDPPWKGRDLRYNEALRRERGIKLGSGSDEKDSRDSKDKKDADRPRGGGGARESHDKDGDGDSRGTPGAGNGSGSTVIGAGGGVGGGGGLGISGGPSLPDYYSRQAVASIAANFTVPEQDRSDKTCVVEFLIRADGSLEDVKVARSSGEAELDKLAVDAVKRTGRIAPLPDSLGNRAVEAVLTFSFVPE